MYIEEQKNISMQPVALLVLQPGSSAACFPALLAYRRMPFGIYIWECYAATSLSICWIGVVFSILSSLLLLYSLLSALLHSH